MIKLYLLLFFVVVVQCANAQTIHLLDSSKGISLRGLSVFNDNVIWASGSKGAVARSVNGGKTFTWQTVKGYEDRDFRDIEAFDANIAIIMAIAEPAIMLKTKDGGKSWYKVFADSTKGMFLDAMDFENNAGFVVGDPINNKMFNASTSDQGETWRINIGQELSSGEAMFASSGTNCISFISSGTYASFFHHLIVTGGKRSRLIHLGITTNSYELPIIQGKETTGANSIATSPKSFVIVGGDFTNATDTTGNCVLSNDVGKTWQHSQTPPHGYRSCVAYVTENKLITCGLTGVDISNDGGNNWQLISNESFHVCAKAKNGKAVFLAGKDGRIAKYE